MSSADTLPLGQSVLLCSAVVVGYFSQEGCQSHVYNRNPRRRGWTPNSRADWLQKRWLENDESKLEQEDGATKSEPSDSKPTKS